MTVILLGALCPEMVLSGMSGILLGVMVQKNSLPLNIHEETLALNLAGSSLWLQGEQALGWGQQCGWQVERKKGIWALEPIRHLACLPSGLPQWASKHTYWYLFELISVSYITENTHFTHSVLCFAKLHLRCGLAEPLFQAARSVDAFHIEV